MSASWTKWVTDPGNIRVVSLDATTLIRQMSAQQQLQGAGQAGYAEAVVGALLIASGHKSGEAINLNAQGSSLYRQAVVDASPDGLVRAFLVEQPDVSKHSYGEHGRNGPWGSGVLSVLFTKTAEGKSPYTGKVPIDTGFLDDAINTYFRDSEQLPSVIGLSVDLNAKTGELNHARGALIQTLGGAQDVEQELVRKIPVESLRDLAHTQDVEGKVPMWLGGRKLKRLETKALDRFCNCSQERIERALLLTGEEDTLDALGSDAALDVTCDFCRTNYKVSRERIKSLFSRDPSRLQ